MNEINNGILNPQELSGNGIKIKTTNKNINIVTNLNIKPK
jgi:hypothetical protein